MEKYKGNAKKNAKEEEIIHMLFYCMKMREQLIPDLYTIRNILVTIIIFHPI